MHGPRVIRTDLQAPEAIVISTTAGRVYVVADHNVSAQKLAAVTLLAEYLPPIPEQRRSDGLG